MPNMKIKNSALGRSVKNLNRTAMIALTGVALGVFGSSCGARHKRKTIQPAPALIQPLLEKAESYKFGRVSFSTKFKTEKPVKINHY
jgi:hypothetical protein